MSIYTALADDIARQIERGALRAGEKLPSVRSLCAARGISQGTVMQAYYLLEDRGLVSTRPRSGYYVNAVARPQLARPAPPEETPEPVRVEVANLAFGVLDSIRRGDNVPLGSAFASGELYPLPKLAQALAGAARRIDPARLIEDLPPGNADLRRHIARRYLEIGARVDAEEIVITSGASEALMVSLLATTRPGDVVAIESPAHYVALHAIETTGRRAVCIPTCCEEGLDLRALERAIAAQPIRAVWAMPTFHNPTGALMPLRRKRELVALLARHEIPLIENDVYGELYFADERPAPCKTWDHRGLVLHCGSFSKATAPGWRVGWVAPGRHRETVRQHKFLLSVGTNIPAQSALADYVRQGGHELQLRRLRKQLESQRDALLRAIARHFAPGTRVSRPQGGYFLWLQLPPGSPDAVALTRRALDEGVSVAPGALFTAHDQFHAHLRLNYGHPWSAQMEQAVATLARLAGGAPPRLPGPPGTGASASTSVAPDRLPLPAEMDCPDPR